MWFLDFLPFDFQTILKAGQIKGGGHRGLYPRRLLQRIPTDINFLQVLITFYGRFYYWKCNKIMLYECGENRGSSVGLSKNYVTHIVWKRAQETESHKSSFKVWEMRHLPGTPDFRNIPNISMAQWISVILCFSRGPIILYLFFKDFRSA